MEVQVLSRPPRRNKRLTLQIPLARAFSLQPFISPLPQISLCEIRGPLLGHPRLRLRCPALLGQMFIALRCGGGFFITAFHFSSSPNFALRNPGAPARSSSPAAPVPCALGTNVYCTPLWRRLFRFSLLFLLFPKNRRFAGAPALVAFPGSVAPYLPSEAIALSILALPLPHKLKICGGPCSPILNSLRSFPVVCALESRLYAGSFILWGMVYWTR